MAASIPGFLTGANLVIRIGDRRIAFAQSLSFQRNVAHTAVMGVGAFDVLALEPTSFAASGSMQILRWTDEALGVAGFGAADQVDSRPAGSLPDNMQKVVGAKYDAEKNDNVPGNSIIDDTAFNPQKLMLSKTFDIEVYEKAPNDQNGLAGVPEKKLLFTLVDCRVRSYGFNFVPGELLIENVSFLCKRIDDSIAQST